MRHRLFAGQQHLAKRRGQSKRLAGSLLRPRGVAGDERDQAGGTSRFQQVTSRRCWVVSHVRSPVWFDTPRRSLRSHAERGNERKAGEDYFRSKLG